MMSAKYSCQERVMPSRGQRWGKELVGRVTAGQEERQRSPRAEPNKSWEVMGQGGTGVRAEERGEWKTKYGTRHGNSKRPQERGGRNSEQQQQARKETGGRRNWTRNTAGNKGDLVTSGR